MSNEPSRWNEADSRLYRELSSVAVPNRTEQIGALLTLLPFNRQDEFHCVEIGSGEGFLSAAILACYPKATLTALDGSAEMRDQTAARLHKFAARGQSQPFDLFTPDWLTHLDGADAVVSSLVLHHLDGSAKQQLYTDVSNRLSSQGCLLIADLVEAPRPEIQEFFAATWDQQTKTAALARTSSTALFEKFQQEAWNLYYHPDPMDKPSSLFKQLIWLEEAGFAVVDCFWMQAGHAIYGGYNKEGGAEKAISPSYEVALQIAQEVLN